MTSAAYVLLQTADRGALWALLALLIVRNLKGTLPMRATITALALAVLGVAQLLYPDSYMPTDRDVSRHRFDLKARWRYCARLRMAASASHESKRKLRGRKRKIDGPADESAGS